MLVWRETGHDFMHEREREHEHGHEHDNASRNAAF